LNAEYYAEIIKASKKYGNICPETIIRIVRSEIGKFNSEKDAVKSVKTKLHKITGAFLGEERIRQAYKLLESLSENTADELIYKILALHASSAERMTFTKEMYKDIFSVTGAEGPILDIACGFNPFCIPLMPEPAQNKYRATEINVKITELLNRFFALTGSSACAYATDIIYTIPDFYTHNVFLFKTLPLLEQQQKGYSKILIDRLDSEFFSITFPTKTLSGKNVGMYKFYNEFMENCFAKNEFEYCLQKEYFNEILYIIRRKKALILY